jgi:hypothetical protein
MAKRRPGRKRRPNDFFPTPLKAVRPLLPFLHGIKRFAEPCAGAGDLLQALEGAGLVCAYDGDVSYGKDALAVENYGGAEVNITNPPFSQRYHPLLRRMILHFQSIAPTWLLLPADFACNEWFAPLPAACTDMVHGEPHLTRMERCSDQITAARMLGGKS